MPQNQPSNLNSYSDGSGQCLSPCQQFCAPDCLYDCCQDNINPSQMMPTNSPMMGGCPPGCVNQCQSFCPMNCCRSQIKKRTTKKMKHFDDEEEDSIL